MSKKSIFFTFRYSDWALSTSLEIMAIELANGTNIGWADWTGEFESSFELPITNRILIRQMKNRFRSHQIVNKIQSFGTTSNLVILQPPKNSIDPNSKTILIAEEVAYLELISRIRDARPNKITHHNLLDKFKLTFLETYDSAIQLLLNEKPEKVFIYNGRFLQERAAWEACKFLDIQVVFFEKFGPNWVDRYFLFEKPTHLPSYRSEIMSSYGDNIKSQDPSFFQLIGDKWFLDRELGITQQFTKGQTSSLMSDSSRPFLVFFHSSEDELITTDLTSKSWGDQEAALRSLVSVLDHICEFSLIIRMHPNLKYKSKNEIKMWTEIGNQLSRKYDWVSFIQHDSKVNSYSLLKDSAAVVTVGSTIGVEAAYLGKRSILLGRAFHEEMGITINPISEVQLENFLVKSYSKKDSILAKQNSLKFGVFHSIGGTAFSIVTRSQKGRNKYYFGSMQITSSNFLTLLSRVEKSLRGSIRFLAYLLRK